MTDGATMTRALGVDPDDARFRHDPYPFYDRLRERGPLTRSPDGFWVAASYGACTTILRDERFGHPEAHVATPEALLGGSAQQRHFVLFMNPPGHTRVRSVLRSVLTPAVVTALKAHVEGTVTRLLDAADPAGFDLIGGFARPLAVDTTCELLGIPAADRDELVSLAGAFLAGIDPTFALDAGRAAARDAAFEALTGYVATLVDHRRATPGDDLVSRLVVATRDSAEVSERELEGAVLLLFVAGHGTTTNLIGNGALAFARHPDARARYRTDPEVAVTGIEELLRFDAPSQLTVRTALADVEVAGASVRRGEQILVLRGAANHDPAVFAQPRRLDLARPDNRHLAFGHGIHRCIGAALARMEGRIAFRLLLDRAPDFRLATSDPLTYVPSVLIRGLRSLPVALR